MTQSGNSQISLKMTLEIRIRKLKMTLVIELKHAKSRFKEAEIKLIGKLRISDMTFSMIYRSVRPETI